MVQTTYYSTARKTFFCCLGLCMNNQQFLNLRKLQNEYNPSRNTLSCSNSEPPSEEEGFNKIDKVDVQLVCDTPYKVCLTV